MDNHKLSIRFSLDDFCYVAFFEIAKSGADGKEITDSLKLELVNLYLNEFCEQIKKKLQENNLQEN